ncbi:MAG: hypothetical protein ACP5C3_07600 [Methanomicrobiales archaeon]
MDRGKIIGIMAGFCSFFILLLAFLYPSMDFDQQLIDSVENGVPKTELISQIEEECDLQKLEVKKSLMAHVIDQKYWNQSNISPEHDLEYYCEICDKQLETIEEYKRARIDFVNGTITKEEFISKSSVLKRRLTV